MRSNEINIKDWKRHLFEDKITTNGIWLTNLSENPIFGHFVIPKRNFLPKPDNNFHGVWIAEVPFQMILRFTKVGDVVWSQFGGTGIDYEVATMLDRKCYINDINPKRDFIDYADSRNYTLSEKADLVLSHPPYWDMVKYSDKEGDGSNKRILEDFLQWWKEIVKNAHKNLKEKGFFVFACGNIYKNSEEIELGNLLLLIALNEGFILKQHIIKDYGETKGSDAKNYNVNYYRQLKSYYGNFYGDNIYILRKQKSKNKVVESLCNVIAKARINAAPNGLF